MSPMHTRFTRAGLWLVVLLMATAPSARAQSSSADQSVAELQKLVVRVRAASEQIQVEQAERMRALQAANEQLRAEQARKLGPLSDKRSSVSGLSAVLVAGSLQTAAATSNAAADDIPAPARKALADMKDFLPYKSYQLLDAAWLRGAGSGNYGGTLRLKGVDGQIYQLDLEGPDASLTLAVRLSEGETFPGASTSGPTAENSRRTVEFLKQQHSQMAKDHAALAMKYSSNHPDVLASKARLAALEQKLAEAETAASAQMAYADLSGRRALMNTRFQMEVGETVVVGTSRVSGDKALILLLTAVAK